MVIILCCEIFFGNLFATLKYDLIIEVFYPYNHCHEPLLNLNRLTQLKSQQVCPPIDLTLTYFFSCISAAARPLVLACRTKH